MLTPILSIVSLIPFTQIISKSIMSSILIISLVLFLIISPICNPYQPLMMISPDLVASPVIMLAIWLFMVVNLSSPNSHLFSLYYISILLMSLLVFSSMNLLTFYIMFELVLIPMFLMIINFGPQPERKESAMYMSMYTIMASLPLLVSLLSLSKLNFSMNYPLIMLMKQDNPSLNSITLLGAFMVKLPMYSIHLWLPKAHVEAPTEGSMILAGILLKLGAFGLIRMLSLISLKPMITCTIMALNLMGAIMCSIICFSQTDLKKLIAYSSIVHMSFLLASLITCFPLSCMAAMIMMVTHGLCSAALFFSVNVIYNQAKTRNIMLIKGVISSSPKLSKWLFILFCANMAAPPFVSLVAEMMMGIVMLKFSIFTMIPLMSIYLLPASYCSYIFSIVSHGLPSINMTIFPVKVKEYSIMVFLSLPIIMSMFMIDLFSAESIFM